jgi:hypothetical protein
MQASEAVAQDLQHQLAEHQNELAQRSLSASLKQSLAERSEQHDKIAEDHNSVLQVFFYIMYLLMYCVVKCKLCCCLCQ